MTWDDVTRIMTGDLPRYDPELSSIEQASTVEAVQTVRCKVEEMFNYDTEMECTIRVLLYVIEASWDLDNVTIELQPSLFGYSTVTFFSYTRVMLQGEV